MKINKLLIKAYFTFFFIFISLFGEAQIAQRGSATTATGGGTSLTINKPTGIAVGDIMIANISESHASNNLSTAATSTGWTLIDSRNLGKINTRGSVLYKIAVASDVSASNYIFALNTGADSCSGAIIAFSGVNASSPFDLAPGTINTTNAITITATGITTVTANAAIIMLGQVGDNRSYSDSAWSTTSPGALTELYDQINATGFDTSVGAAWAIKATAGATGNGTATLSGSNRNGSILLALRPAPPTITSLGSLSGCVGSSITINGTNLTGATPANVTIGGTAVSSITSNTGTVLVAVIGSGTTGTVQVTTGGGTATSTDTFTVNSLPTITGTTPGNRSGTGTVPLAATASAGTISWFANSTGGSALGTGTSFTTPSISTTTTYYVETTNGSCTSSPRTAIIATVNQPEIDITGNSTTITDGDTTPSLTDNTIFTTIEAISGNTTTRTFTILNTGNGILNLSGTPIVQLSNSTNFTVTAIPTSTVAATNGSTTFTIEFKSLVAGTFTSTVTINNNDSTENPYTFEISGTATTPLSNGPGGVMSNLQLWLRSDLLNGTTSIADNTPVNTWNTQARGTNATINTAGQEPRFYNNATKNINFNAVVDFTNDYNNAPNETNYTYTPQQYLQGSSGFYTQDMFVVVLPDTQIASTNQSMDIFCGDSPDVGPTAKDGSGIGFGKYSIRTTDEVISYCIGTTPTDLSTPENDRGYGVAQTGTATYNNVGIINTRNNLGITGQELYYNALNISNKEVGIPLFRNLDDTRYWIGRSQAFRSSLDGRVGEIITYSSRLTDIQRSNVQSYLAVKYGITLGVNGTSMNYTNSDGNIIWNTNTGTPANDVFNYNIAGIGRDDIAKLNQKQSKTVNTNDDITIGLTDIAATNTANSNTFDSDKKFLVWGNNNGTLAAQPAVTVNMSSGIAPALITNVEYVSIGRTWKIVETGGNVAETKVSIPTIMLSATLTPPGDYLMFISSTPNFDPTAEYRIMRVNGSNLETSYDFDGTKYITFGFAPDRTFVRCISFDGANDYLDAGKVLNLNSSFTVSSWIKRNSTNQTILSKRDNAFSTGYDLSINSTGKAEMSWINGTKQTITSTATIPSGIWHNVAVTFDGTNAKLYIDGILDVTKAMSIVPANTQSFLIAAADGVNTTSYFNGGIDEVRVWNVALTDKQLRYVMNQEILKNGLATNGSIVPNSISLNEISTIPWANLSAYYPMSTYTYTNTKDISNNNYTAALRNLTTVDRQTAPLPYESASDGAWETPATWQNNSVQDLPNSLSIVDGVTPVNWNIVRTSYNISSTGNKTVLGLMVNSNTLTASNDTKIEVTNYLKLDGKIDLVGMSQLVQTMNCDLDVTSTGSIERDQQGQANKYNYNYWCSPVSPITPIAPFANNTNYTVAGIMKDGFNTTPREISWIAGYNGIAGNASTPMSIARYWLYTFDNKANDYANWNKITETTSIRVGLGFTMKGSATTGTQNYTFVGKPNNGLINSNTVLPDQLLLTGNPYPSALDAVAFITDNVGSVDRGTDGTLYFWEHYSSNNSHVLGEYKGGYGVRNLVGGVPPVSSGVDFIDQSGTSTRGIPNRYIPVGQGFFVNGSGTGGTIIFNNNQRAFFKESDAINSNAMYKTRPKNSKTSTINHWNNNSNDVIQKDNYKKVRLGFNSNNKYHRQVLLGFMNEKATSGMDYGYDAISLDEVSNDMYFINGENQLVIQGEGYFDINASYPIGVKTNVEGTVVSFKIDALENFDASQNVYIYDDETKTYNNIQTNAFEVILPAGVNNTRFSLRFSDKSSETETTLGLEEKNIENDINIAHIQNSKTLNVSNYSLETTVEKITLFNINGKLITKWDIKNQDQKNIQIPIDSISSGVYIVKLKTTTGELSKKIIVQ